MEEKSSRSVCTEIAEEVREMAAWLSIGRLSAGQFRAALLALEEEKVKRFGFKLTGENSPTGRSHFELRFASDNALCATLDFDSGTSELTVHHLCG